MPKPPKRLVVQTRAEYRVGARRRNLAFDLTLEQFEKLIKQKCHYCKRPPSNVRVEKRKTKTHRLTYNGIDRVDNSKGYVEGNCVACCMECNVAKSSMTVRKFYNWIKRVFKNGPWKNA